MVSLKTLRFIALAGGPIVLGSAVFFKRRILKNFQNQEFCSKSIEVLHGHTALVEKIGSPIQLKNVDLAKRDLNYTSGLEARVAIPLVGKSQRATLHCWSSRPELGTSWTIDKCDIEFANSPPWTFFINPHSLSKHKPTEDPSETIDKESLSLYSESEVMKDNDKALEYLSIK